MLRQLPFAVSYFLSSVFIGIYAIDDFFSAAYLTSFAVAVVATALATLVPWRRMNDRWGLLIPALDFVVVILSRNATLESVGALGFLAVLPAIWIASIARWRGVAVSTFMGFLVVLPPLLDGGGALTLSDGVRFLLLPLIVFMTAANVHVATERGRQQRRQLKSTESNLRQALDHSRRSEMLLDSIINTVDIGILTLDEHGSIQMKNKSLIEHDDKATERSIPTLLQARNHLFELDRHTRIPATEGPLARAARGETYADVVVWVGDDPMNQRAISTFAKPIPSTDGNFAGSVIALRDVTVMMNALHAKDEFVASVSHELRTPLTSIMGYLELIHDEQESLPDDVNSSVRVISRNAERLLVLVSDLLLAAQSEGGTLRLSKDSTALHEVALRSVQAAKPAADKHGLALLTDIEQVPLIEADEQRLSQVIDNLLSNAVKYTPAGGSVTVKVSAAGGNDVGGNDVGTALTVEVTDTGMGIPEGEQHGIFTKFFRSDAVVQRAIPGVGLGLVISRSIVKAHGGELTLTSRENEGTTVCMVLPAQNGVPPSRDRQPA